MMDSPSWKSENALQMTGSYLQLRFLDDGDGTGKLVACAEADGFRGEGSAYFDIKELEGFANAIALFPLPGNDKRLSIASGFCKKDGSGELDQEHLAISVCPADARRGYIGIQVRMTTELWEGTRPESQKSAKIEVVTTYEPLSRFSKDLLAVLQGKTREALLEGETIS
jgi:hypothetical protein